jgi:hypothetical protein
MGGLDCATGGAQPVGQVIEVNCGVDERDGEAKPAVRADRELELLVSPRDSSTAFGMTGNWVGAQVFRPIGDCNFAGARELTELEHRNAALRVAR